MLPPSTCASLRRRRRRIGPRQRRLLPRCRHSWRACRWAWSALPALPVSCCQLLFDGQHCVHYSRGNQQPVLTKSFLSHLFVEQRWSRLPLKQGWEKGRQRQGLTWREAAGGGGAGWGGVGRRGVMVRLSQAGAAWLRSGCTRIVQQVDSWHLIPSPMLSQSEAAVHHISHSSHFKCHPALAGGGQDGVRCAAGREALAGGGALF